MLKLCARDHLFPDLVKKIREYMDETDIKIHKHRLRIFAQDSFHFIPKNCMT